MKGSAKKPTEIADVQDEPGMAERFQRGLQRALNTPISAINLVEHHELRLKEGIRPKRK
jgi:hypothetical protein